MKDILAPIVSAFLAFVISFVGLKAKTRETKVTESGVVLKGYNDLLANHEAEFRRRDKRIEELEDENQEKDSEIQRLKIAHMRYIQEHLREKH